MIGYLKPNRVNMTALKNQQYFNSQCGMCQQLKRDYGSIARFWLNRDALILQLLAEAQFAEKPPYYKVRCCVPPFSHDALSNYESRKFSAAVTIMMLWGKAVDTINDSKGLKGCAAKLMLKSNKNKFSKAEKNLKALGFDPQIIYDLFAKQQKLEKISTFKTLDEIATPTAEGVAALFGHTAIIANCPENEKNLKKIGWLTGEILYILDAIDDLVYDFQAEQFNPFKSLLTNKYDSISSLVAYIKKHAFTYLYQKHDQLTEMIVDFQFNHHQEILYSIFCDNLKRHIDIISSYQLPEKAPTKVMFLKTQLAGGCCFEGDNDCGTAGDGPEGHCNFCMMSCCH